MIPLHMIDAAVSTAVNGWELALTGRFRLLDQWCAFVQVKVLLHYEHLYCIDSFKSNEFISMFLAHELTTCCRNMHSVLLCELK